MAERENFKVWSGRPKPAVDFHTGGNHECAAINRIYGFCDECKRAYGLKVWKQFNDVFNCMPVRPRRAYLERRGGPPTPPSP